MQEAPNTIRKVAITVASLLVFAAGLGFVFYSGDDQNNVSSDAIVETDAPLRPTLNNNDNTLSQNTRANLNELPESIRNEIQELREYIAESQRERDDMREQIRVLQDQVDTLQASALIQGDVNTNDSSTIIGGESTNTTTQANRGRNRLGNRNGDRFGGGQVSSDVRRSGLEAAGIDSQTIASIAERSDQFELERLELIDRAARDGTRGSDEFRDEIHELEESRVDIREEIGDDAYNEYLLATGSANRVAIESIINGSAASIAGLQTERATRAGNRGEDVEIEITRAGGERQYYSIERGPMGVTLGNRIQR